MALDEALFSWTIRSGQAAARFYRWDHDAETIGYFSDAREGAIRRFTGGGLVEHGKDVTFALTFPAGSAPSLAGGTERYRWIHEALASALGDAGHGVRLVGEEINALRGPCFSHAVPWDLVDPLTGEKLCGGAQRRSRGSVIHQGSVRLRGGDDSPAQTWVAPFLNKLAETVLAFPAEEVFALVEKAEILEKERYLTREWNEGSGKML